MDRQRVARPPEKGAELNARIVFVDETGVSLIPNARKTWAKRGKTPVLKHQFRWPKLSAIGGITPDGKLYFRVHDGSIKQAQVVAFLKHLMRHEPRRVLILWDGGPTHKSKIVQAFLAENADRLEAHRLPAYAPELNPIELLFSHLKNQQLANNAPHDVRELRRSVRLAIMRVRVRPARIRNIIRGCELPCEALL